ncbi:MAG: DUF6585 family protein [Chloroflexota bacterium]
MKEQSIPLHFQNIEGLGKPIRTYSRSTLSKFGYIFGIIVGFAVGIYLLLEGLVWYPQRFPDVADSNSPYVIGLGVVFLLGSLYFTWRIVTRWNEMLVVYEKGFAYFTGRRMEVFKWKEITMISMHVIKQMVYGVIPAGTQRKYQIRKQSGEEIKLDGSLSEPDDFINRVREGANPYIFSRTKEYFETDQLLDFGAVAISKTKGIIKGKKNYLWSDIGQISVNKGTMWVEPKEKGLFRRFSFPVTGMANFDILMMLAYEMAEKNK